MNPRYPIYIPTKGRWKTPYTIRAFQRLSIPFKAVIEAQEHDHYAAICSEENLLVLPHSNEGLVKTRNWIWDHAAASNVSRFWTFDDNIRAFYRLNDNIKYRVTSGTFLAIIEDFADRYKNLPIVGMNYEMFAPRKRHHYQMIFNTRIYSNMLIETQVSDLKGEPYRNEGFYNDDTDLCLRILKDGYCTVLFNAFLADKIVTMTVKGGMTKYYEGDGRLKMAQELQRKHPDAVKIVWKWGRWQHQVDYRPFKHNKLIMKEGVQIPEGINEYGMKLVDLSKSVKAATA